MAFNPICSKVIKKLSTAVYYKIKTKLKITTFWKAKKNEVTHSKIMIKISLFKELN